jgi:hypothetical protein
MKTPASLPLVTALTATLALGVFSGCGSNEEPYKPAPAWTGAKPNLPTPPQVSITIKSGDAYTVAGVSHHLRSRVHESHVNDKELTIEGYIVESNIPGAPACALHPMGKKDPDNCKTEIPSFWIADTADGKGARIRVLGFAKNFAVVYEAMKKYKGLKEAPKELVKDDVWQTEVPYPIPAVGAKVKVTGQYGFVSQKSGTGLVSDPVNGVLTFKKMEVLTPAAQPATFQNAKI